MRDIGAVLGLVAALALLTAGLILLPDPGLGSTEGLFTAVWLLVAMAAALSFGKAAWKRQRLDGVRRRWRRAARRAPGQATRRRFSGEINGFAPMRERERRLD